MDTFMEQQSVQKDYSEKLSDGNSLLALQLQLVSIPETPIDDAYLNKLKENGKEN